jgi:hypothetical protein
MKTTQMTLNRSLALVAGLMMCILTSTVCAQEPQQPRSPGPQQPQDQPADPAQQPVGPQQPASQALREDYSDAELKSFVNANKRVASIQEETEQKIIGQIEQNGLTVDRFNEILAGQQNPSKKDSIQASSEELAAFNQIAQSIVSENEKVKDRIETSIEEEGINIDTYEAIMVAYQFSPKVQQRIHKLLEKQEP